MKTLNWEKIWKEFDERIRFGSQWEDQKRIIVELVEKGRNEKPLTICDKYNEWFEQKIKKGHQPSSKEIGEKITELLETK